MWSLVHREMKIGVTIGSHFHYVGLGAIASMLFNPFRTFTVSVMCRNLYIGS